MSTQVPPTAPRETFPQQREEMVRTQLQRRGIRDVRVLDVMRRVPRELFLPEPSRGWAYDDRALSIGFRSTISQPYIVALMTELLEVKPNHKVLEIGTGSGYQAAILNELAGKVYSIEIVPQLAERARNTLEELGYRKVVVRAGDGYLGWPEEAPFDRILITAAPPRIPQTLLDQLGAGGRLVAPEGESPASQQLVIVKKDSRGNLSREYSIPVIFVPMVPKVPAPEN